MKTHFKIIKLNETPHWDDSVVEKAGNIYGYYLIDVSRETHLCSIQASYEAHFLYNRLDNTDGFSEEELTENERNNGGEEISYFDVNSKFTVVKDFGEVEAEDYVPRMNPTEEEIYKSYQEMLLEQIKCNPIE